MKIPNDPVILLSFVNMKLRDSGADFSELCKTLCVEEEPLLEKLRGIGYFYRQENNQFVTKK